MDLSPVFVIFIFGMSTSQKYAVCPVWVTDTRNLLRFLFIQHCAIHLPRIFFYIRSKSILLMVNLFFHTIQKKNWKNQSNFLLFVVPHITVSIHCRYFVSNDLCIWAFIQFWAEYSNIAILGEGNRCIIPCICWHLDYDKLKIYNELKIYYWPTLLTLLHRDNWSQK